MKLTVKQKRFVDEYISSGNATQAALNAGYSQKTAAVTGNENLKKPVIKKYIDERLKKIDSAKIMSAKQIRERLSLIASGGRCETRLTEQGEAIEIAASTKDQLKAMDLLGKTMGLYSEKLEVRGSINNPYAGLTTDELRELIRRE